MPDHIATEEAERIIERLSDLIPRIRAKDETDLRTLTVSLTEAGRALRSLAAERDRLRELLSGRTMSCSACNENGAELMRLQEIVRFVRERRQRMVNSWPPGFHRTAEEIELDKLLGIIEDVKE